MSKKGKDCKKNWSLETACFWEPSSLCSDWPHYHQHIWQWLQPTICGKPFGWAPSQDIESSKKYSKVRCVLGTCAPITSSKELVGRHLRLGASVMGDSKNRGWNVQGPKKNIQKPTKIKILTVLRSYFNWKTDTSFFQQCHYHCETWMTMK